MASLLKYQLESEKLPPTPSALKFKIHRSHYVCLIWQSSMSKPNLPDPNMYGWETAENGLLPVTTDALPAPKAVLEMSVCSCKTKCSTNRCKM